MNRAAVILCLMLAAAGARAQDPRGYSVGLWADDARTVSCVADAAPAVMGIHGGNSWIRDCGFALNGPEVPSDPAVDDPGCGCVPTAGAAWGTLHARDRDPAAGR